MTSNELLSQVRTIIDETEAGGTVSDNEIYLALTQAQDYIVSFLVRNTAVPPDNISKLRNTVSFTPTLIETFTVSSKTIAKYKVAVPTDSLKIFNVKITLQDNAQSNYTVIRGIPILPYMERTEWSWRGDVNGRQQEFYYYQEGNNIIILFLVNNDSFAMISVDLDYIKKSSNIDNTAQPSIIGFDAEMVAYASYIIFNKLRLPNAQLQYQVFSNLLGGASQIPNGEQQ